MKTKRIQRWLSGICIAVLLLAGETRATAQSSGRSDTVVITGQSSPSSIVGSGPFSGFDAPVINSAGQVAFKGSFTSGGTVNGVYLGTTSGVSNIAIQGTSASGGGTFSLLSDPGINDAGQVIFSSATTGGPGSGLYLGTTSGVTSVALQGTAAPGGGTYSSFSGDSNVMVINDAGQTVFGGLYLGTTSSVSAIALGGSNAPAGGTFTVFGEPNINAAGEVTFVANVSEGSYYGIFLGSTSGISQIAATGLAAPGGGVFSNFPANVFSPAINGSGQVAFYASTSGASAPGEGLYFGNTSAVNSIALVGTSAPGGGVFSGFSLPSINNSGKIAFYATTTGAPGSGLYVGSTSGVTSIALQGSSAPGGGAFTAFPTSFFDDNQLAFNNSGDAAFLAFNGSSTNLYIGDGTNLIEAVGYGSSVGGSTINNISLANAAGSQGAGDSPLNDLGQIAYKASLANGTTGIFIYTPTLHWRMAGSGTWGTSANWTLGINPASVHDVAIDPSSSLTVTGPSVNTTVNSLQVGGGAGTANLDLQTGVTLSATKGVTVLASGSVSGNGVIAGNVSNSGLFSPGDPLGSIQVTGSFLQTGAGTLKMELGGLTPGSGYDTLDVSGSLTLGGTLDVALSGGFTPALGETFELFEGGSETGSFSQVSVPALGAGLSWDTSELAANGSVTVVPEPGPAALLGGAALLMLVCRRKRQMISKMAPPN